MSKSALYAVNLYDQTTTASQKIISFTDVVRRFGCNVELSGGNAVVAGYGYYDVDVFINGVASGTSIVVQLYDDGVAVPGANVSLVTTADSTYNVVLPAMIKRTCNCETALTVGVTGAGTVNGASIRVVKL